MPGDLHTPSEFSATAENLQDGKRECVRSSLGSLSSLLLWPHACNRALDRAEKPADRVQVGKRCKFVRGYSIKWVGNFLGLLRQDRASRPYVFFRLSEAHRFNCFGAVRDKILIKRRDERLGQLVPRSLRPPVRVAGLA